jgi:hypothetical protein
MSSSETQALLNGDEQKRTSKSSSSFTSPLKAATAIVAVSTSLFATASYSVSGTRGSSSSRLGDLSQREGGVDLFKRAVANLGEDATTTTTVGSNDKVTLTVGCSHRDVLKRLPFDPEGWDSKVGAKLITESKSKTFSYEDAIEMKEIGCGKFQTPYKLGKRREVWFLPVRESEPGELRERYWREVGIARGGRRGGSGDWRNRRVFFEEEDEEDESVFFGFKTVRDDQHGIVVLYYHRLRRASRGGGAKRERKSEGNLRVVVGERREEEARVLEEIGEKARRRRNRGRGIRGRCG